VLLQAEQKNPHRTFTFQNELLLREKKATTAHCTDVTVV